MADSIDWGAVNQQLQQKAGANYDPSMLGDVQRNSSYGQDNNQGSQASVDDWVNRVVNKSQLKSTNETNSTYQANGQGGVTVGPTGNVNTPSNPYPVSGVSSSMNNSSAGGSSGGSSAPSSAPTQNSAFQNQLQANATSLYNTLLDRSKQSLSVGANDPIIKGQVDAYRAENDRDSRNAQTQWAESSGPYANPQGQERMLAEKSAQATSGLQASLMGNELTARRNDIQNALTQMGGLLTSEQQTALQQQLGLINANLAQQGIGLQQQQINSGNDQFAATYGLNSANQANYWDALRSGLLNS